MATPKNAVVKKEEAALPVPMEELEALSGQGFENADKDSYAIPFLRILQTNSPQCEEGGPAYVEGAKPGMLYNTVTNQILGKEVLVIPVSYNRDFVEWKPNRGGFVKSHGNDPSILDDVTTIDEKNNSILSNGNVVQDTRNHYVLLADYLECGPVIVSMTSTGIRHSRKWMSRMNALMIPNSAKQAPMFAGVWKLETVRNQNDDGSWHQFGDKNSTAIAFERFVNKNELDHALAARELLNSGQAKVDYETAEPASTGAPGAEQGPIPGMEDGDIPF